MTKVDEKTRGELAAIRDRVLLTVHFMDEAEDLGPIGAQMRTIVEAAFAKDDIRAMRLVARDVDALTNSLPSHQREGLEALLKNRLGIDKDVERSETSRRIAAVLKRGAIRSEKERRHLEDHLEMLEATGCNPGEAEAVRRLLHGS